MTTQPYKSSKEVEREFDERFDEVILDQEVRTVVKGIKIFIHALRQADREAIIGEVYNMQHENDEGDYLYALANVINYLKSL